MITTATIITDPAVNGTLLRRNGATPIIADNGALTANIEFATYGYGAAGYAVARRVVQLALGPDVTVVGAPGLGAIINSAPAAGGVGIVLAGWLGASIHAGSLLKAHGGFILLHLHDLVSEEGLWARLRRFLRCSRLHIDESGSSGSGSAPVALQPEAVTVDVKIVLIGSVDEYYALQETDPDTARRFRAKVDFVERFAASPATRIASAIFVAHSCKRRNLPHFGATAVALLLEQAHREADLHIHDLDMLAGYCAGWSLRQLLHEGLVWRC